MAKTQRIRDTVHNLIEFDGGEFEQTCWKVLNTRPMQRLRRIKQLGFSEFVYPGACHSRFAHSVGVFHTARQLAGVVQKRLGGDRYDTDEARLAMAAALVHDIGHGPFSHAFEDALKRLGISKRHELRTKQILEETNVVEAFEEFPDFPRRIGELIEAAYPKNIYASLVSSQFDADRLDYMRRDRLMSGTQQSGIDYDWLIANLHVRKVPIQVDGENVGKAEALVIDEKSIVAAEGYIFSLLYLYINVYFHKTTRGLEKIFSALVELLAERVRGDDWIATGLPKTHPLVQFLQDPEAIGPFLQLDDSVVMGSLSMLADADDKCIAELAIRIRDRKIYNCVDVTKRMAAKFGLPSEGSADTYDENARAAAVAARVARVGELAIERGLLARGSDGVAGVLEDTAPRSPYKRVSDGARPFSRIHVIGADDQLHDLADMSPAVNALGDFKAYRLYVRHDSDREAVEQLIKDASQ
jgi:HD superfamily phosphohydrolase